MDQLSAVVLAAGEGTRLRPLTTHRPKPMLPGATRPILEHVLDSLVEAGLADITLVVGYGRNRVQSHFGPRYRDVPLTYVTQEKQLGTGHALLEASEVVDGPTLVVYGDQLIDAEIVADVVRAHRNEADAVAATLGVLEREDVSEYGGVHLEDGRVQAIVERPRESRHYLLNAGVYVIEPRAIDAIRAVETREGEQSLVDGIDRLIEAGDAVQGIVSSGRWADATYPWDLLSVAVELFDADDDVRTGDRNEPGASGAPKIHDTAVLRDPVAIDVDCEIGPGAIVGPYAALGENTTIGPNAVVERSLLDRDTRIGANATVCECVTGVGVEIGPGSAIPGGPGNVRVGDRIHEDEALGALLADRVVDGGSVTYEPGTIVGAGARLSIGATVGGRIDEGMEVRS